MSDAVFKRSAATAAAMTTRTGVVTAVGDAVDDGAIATAHRQPRPGHGSRASLHEKVTRMNGMSHECRSGGAVHCNVEWQRPLSLILTLSPIVHPLTSPLVHITLHLYSTSHFIKLLDTLFHIVISICIDHSLPVPRSLSKSTASKVVVIVIVVLHHLSTFRNLILLLHSTIG